jgi:hypothetical protein
VNDERPLPGASETVATTRKVQRHNTTGVFSFDPERLALARAKAGALTTNIAGIGATFVEGEQLRERLTDLALAVELDLWLVTA